MATIIVNDLTIYTFEGENYFVGKEICELLDYKIITSTLLCISSTNKLLFNDFRGEKIPLMDPRTILITKRGIEEILNSNRSKKISNDALFILGSYDIRPRNKEHRELTEYSYFTQDGIIFEYFVGYEIATLLGYRSPNQTVKDIVSKSNQIYFKDYVGEKIPPLNPKTVLITRDGAIEILLKTRKRLTPDTEHILKKFNITTTNRKCLTKEQKTLSEITTVFKTDKFEDQYKVGNYYIDLYFPEYKIVVECDENGHKDRKPFDEKERTDFINKELNIDDSYWVRFNPDEHDFNISRVIGKIHGLIFTIKTNEFNKKMEKIEKSVVLRRCKVCYQKKNLTEEFTANGVGYTLICKDCSTSTINDKPVNQYELDGTFVKRFDSMKKASAETKIFPCQISANCRNIVKTAGKYMWKFADNLGTENVDKIKYDLYKTVAQYNTNGDLVKTYKSVGSACKELKINPRNVYSAIRNNFISHGFIWKYVKDDIVVPKVQEVTPLRKYMKQVEIYKDGSLFKSFNSIKESSVAMKVNISMCRKFLSGKDDKNGFVWRFK